MTNNYNKVIYTMEAPSIKIQWLSLLEYMGALSDHFDTMKSFISLVQKGQMEKSLVETLCPRSLTEFNAYITKILKENNIVT